MRKGKEGREKSISSDIRRNSDTEEQEGKKAIEKKQGTKRMIATRWL